MGTARSQRHIQCLLCSKQPTLNNFTNHLKMWHPEHASEPRRQFYSELSSEVALRAPVPAVGLELDPLGPEDVDTIVLAVAEQIAGRSGQFPVADLPALFAWRAATSTFLRAVHDRQSSRRR